MKGKNKVKTEYGYILKVKGQFESITVEQEENVPDRNAILVKLYQDRWRTPEEYVEFLKKVIILIERDFISKLKENETKK